jgi:4-hydroxyphenylpyruvate dioxygenase
MMFEQIETIATDDQISETIATGDQLKGIDYVELYVGNARQAMHYYRTAFGFTPVAYAGPETGVRDRVSYAVQQGSICLVLTSALDSDSPIANHVNAHGDGIKDIAFTVDSAEKVFNEVCNQGAQPVIEPKSFEDDYGQVTKATVSAFGDTVHSFIERSNHTDAFFPGFRALTNRAYVAPTALNSIDHIAIAVEQGTVDRWVDYYRNVLGFHQSLEEDIATDYSAMNSKVVQNSTGGIISVLVEPATGKRRSPIDEYLMYYGGAGVHHIALSSRDIVYSVGSLSGHGVDFTYTPHTYYDELERRIGRFDADVNALRDLHILVDRDEWGYLMQIFSKPVQSRPTFFFEIIQRVGARGFGSGNIKALFEAIEREQLLRGNG